MSTRLNVMPVLEQSARETLPAFSFLGKRACLLVEQQGTRLRGCQAQLADLEAEIAAALKERGPEACIYGALPFEPEAPAALYVTEQASWEPRLERGSTPPWSGPLAKAFERGAGEEAYVRMVESARQLLRAGELDKVVLARSRSLPMSLSPRAVWSRLRRWRGDAYAYALELEQQGAASSHWLMGMSPELLVSQEHDVLMSLPLAGSCRRAKEGLRDRALSRQLLDSAKDREEHELVAASIESCMSPWVDTVERNRIPQLIKTPQLWHLGTSLQGRRLPSAPHSLGAALRLLPTPAVCGLPVAGARRFIQEHESGPRGLFTGAVGYMRADGSGEWAVTIRCAHLAPGRVTVSAGAGILAASDPEAELQETETKMLTMLAVLLAEDVS